MQKATPATTALARQGRPQSLPTMPTTALPCLASLVFTALPAAGRRGCPRLARRYGRPAGISRWGRSTATQPYEGYESSQTAKKTKTTGLATKG